MTHRGTMGSLALREQPRGCIGLATQQRTRIAGRGNRSEMNSALKLLTVGEPFIMKREG
jgi:hypothetical protein